jgi:hypothetical protein
MYFFLPTLPATLQERRALRPIANHTERWQRMLDRVVELTQVAEDAGFDAVCFPRASPAQRRHGNSAACRRSRSISTRPYFDVLKDEGIR